MKTGAQSSFVRSIRLSDAELRAVIEGADTGGGLTAETIDGAPWFQFRKDNCVVHLQQPGDASSTPYLTVTLSLSSQAIVALHGSFVHTGSRCVVQLIGLRGSWEDVPGVVSRCRLVQNNIHQIVVRFDVAIDPGLYCAEANRLRVLVIDDDPFSLRLATAYLNELNADVEQADTGEKGVAMALETPYDVIFMDISMPGMDGYEATRKLRDEGYRGMIIAATALESDADRKKCTEAGCDRYMGKPFSQEDFLKIVAVVKDEPLFSTLSTEEFLVEHINAFVAELPSIARALEEASVGKDLEKLESLARSLKGEAGGYGFDPITAAARQLEEAVRDKAGNEQIQDHLGMTLKWCRLARSTT